MKNSISNTREQRNFNDIQRDHKANLKRKAQEAQISFINHEINELKEEIIKDVKESWFTFAKANLNRIDKLLNEMYEIRKEMRK
jgi:hypothetical protein